MRRRCAPARNYSEIRTVVRNTWRFWEVSQILRLGRSTSTTFSYQKQKYPWAPLHQEGCQAGWLPLGDQDLREEGGLRRARDQWGQKTVCIQGTPQMSRYTEKNGARILPVREESYKYEKRGKVQWTLWCWTGTGDTGINSRLSVYLARYRNEYRHDSERVCVSIS